MRVQWTREDEFRDNFVQPPFAHHIDAGVDAAGRLRWIEAREGVNTVSWRAHFDDYAPVDGHAFAHTLLLELSAGRVEAEMALRDIELNPSLPPDIFTLEPPPAVGEGG